MGNSKKLYGCVFLNLPLSQDIWGLICEENTRKKILFKYSYLSLKTNFFKLWEAGRNKTAKGTVKQKKNQARGSQFLAPF